MGKQIKDDTELYRRHTVANDEFGRWDVYEGGCFLGSFESESEANLYAASLQMLEALRQVKLELLDIADTAGDDSHYNEGGSTYEVIQLVNAAIAKAEGL